MNITDKAFEAVLDVIENSGIRPILGRDAEDVHEVLRKYVVRCLWKEKLDDGRKRKRIKS